MSDGTQSTSEGREAAKTASRPITSGTSAIELRNISKRFGDVQANRDVSLTVSKGSIHGIVGENGAGKSTLMSILYGYYRADSGQILIDGHAVEIGASEDAIKAGIGMVHQHFMLVDTFTVLENVVLGVEGGTLLAAGLSSARSELERLEREYNLDVDPDSIVADLPVGLQQRVEILKALYRGAEILILDEPTGVLTPREADHLFRILAALRDQGKTVILITHKLREIMAITEQVSVMRQGEMVAQLETAKTSTEDLAELMVGRKVLLRVNKAPANPGRTVLDVEELRVLDDIGVARVDGVSFSVRSGEIVGVAGVSGNGQSELLEALSGTTPVTAGRISLNGNDITHGHPRDARELRQLGLAHVPEDRQRMGLITAFEADESSILGYHKDPAYNRGLFLLRDTIIASCRRAMNSYDVRPADPLLRTASFSGGNQQKIVLAREMERKPDLLLVGQPTRGVDIGAVEFIHTRLIAMRDAGAAILLVSVELDEIVSLSDRILVMFDGRIVGELATDDADERTLGLMMAGIDPASHGGSKQ